MSAIWSQSLNGRAIDLVDPKSGEVDFDELARTMAGVYRWCGSSETDISIALHTLIGLDVIAGMERQSGETLDRLRQYWLLHDAHEARTGDITRPVQQALAEVAKTIVVGRDGVHPDVAAAIVKGAIKALQARHDLAIRAAAGVPLLLDDETSQAVKFVDNATMMVERRDFLVEPPRAWAAALEQAATQIDALHPASAIWRNKAECAYALLTAFRQHLPVFNRAA